MEDDRQDLEALLDRALQNDGIGQDELSQISRQIMTKCNDIRRDLGVPIGGTSLSGVLVCEPTRQMQCMAVASDAAYAKCVEQACHRKHTVSVEDSMFNTCFHSPEAARSFRERVVNAYRKRANRLVAGNYVILPPLLARSSSNESLRMMLTPRGRFNSVSREAGNALFLFFEEGTIVPMVLEDMVPHIPYGKLWSIRGMRTSASLTHELT